MNCTCGVERASIDLTKHRYNIRDLKLLRRQGHTRANLASSFDGYLMMHRRGGQGQNRTVSGRVEISIS